MASAFLTGEWRKLIMANYIVDPKILIKHLPYKTVPDSWNGNCYVSLVGFMFRETRVRGIKIPFHVNFPEVNLRFYVKYKDGNEWKRGVVFLKEIVPRPAIAFVANRIYKEKYVSLPMKQESTASADQLDIAYMWKYRRRWNRISVQTTPLKEPLQAGSEEEFITEHFWGYSRMTDTCTGEYQVAHPSWDIYKVNKFEISCDFGGLYGEEFSTLEHQRPQSVFMAEGSAITVFKKKLIR